MTGAILIGSLTFCLASTVHYFTLTRLYGVITARLKPGYWAMLAGICGAGAAHLIEAMLYAFGFAVMDSTGLGVSPVSDHETDWPNCLRRISGTS